MGRNEPEAVFYIYYFSSGGWVPKSLLAETANPTPGW